MDPAFKIEVSQTTLTVYPGSTGAVSIVGRDGLVATVLTGTGELLVSLEQSGQPLWAHTFKYALPDSVKPSDEPPQPQPHDTNHVGNGPVEMPKQQRGRGRPRIHPLPAPNQTLGAALRLDGLNV